MVTNIKEFVDLSFNSIRQIWLCLKREKFYANTVVIRFGQVCDWSYFVEKGQLMVYVWNEMTKSATHFQKISSGGWCNFVNSITDHSSIFIIRTIGEWELLKLSKSDLESLSKVDHNIDDALKLIRSKFL